MPFQRNITYNTAVKHHDQHADVVQLVGVADFLCKRNLILVSCDDVLPVEYFFSLCFKGMLIPVLFNFNISVKVSVIIAFISIRYVHIAIFITKQQHRSNGHLLIKDFNKPVSQRAVFQTVLNTLMLCQRRRFEIINKIVGKHNFTNIAYHRS